VFVSDGFPPSDYYRAFVFCVHPQLFLVGIVFVCGIDRTSNYGGCVAVSALIHYFTLVAVMWMGAEAVLMFQKLVIVFFQITTKFLVAVSLVCWCKY